MMVYSNAHRDNHLLHIDWATAQATYPGQPLSGDGCMVDLSSSRALIALLDGLGHGPDAAAASQAGLEALRTHADADAQSLIMHCHHAMTHTRGAAVSLAVYSAATGRMTWLGVGNVNGLFLPRQSAREHLVTRGGIVGYHMPSLYITALHPQPGDTLVFASDGIRSDFAGAVTSHDSPQKIANHLLLNYRDGVDDATVCVVRFRLS